MKKVINYAMFICMLVVSDAIAWSFINNRTEMDEINMLLIVIPIILETMFAMTTIVPDIQSWQKKSKAKKAKQNKANTEFKVLEKESA